MSVAPEPPAGLVDLPVFKKPVPTVPTPLEAFDPAYVERRKQITEKILKLKNGRQLAYFTEGTPTDKAVLCLHSLGQSKLEWIMPKPLPGVFLIAVDRQGHGNSSPYPPGLPPSAPARRFADDIDEYVELLDSLNVDKFFRDGIVHGWMLDCCDCCRAARAGRWLCPDLRADRPMALERHDGRAAQGAVT